MVNLIDDEEYDLLYFSNKIPTTMYPEKFDFKKYSFTNLSNEHREIIRQLLIHYLSLVQSVYGYKFLEHIPRNMRNLLSDFDIISIFENNAFNFNDFPTKSYSYMIRNSRKYVCENVYFYSKPVRVMEYYDFEKRTEICVRSQTKPRMLKQIAADVYINSKQWIYTSILDLIQYNFKDLVFSDNISESYTFYDVLLMKFVFQYFLKRNDTNFPTFKLICKCTYGFKNKNHLKVGLLKNGKLPTDVCVLCNAMEKNVFKKYLLNENKHICLCED